VKVEYQS